jgi:hypothetical protein
MRAEKLEDLLQEAQEWCSQERGQSELADYMGVSRQQIPVRI